jgi:hypothetical protein
MRWRKEATVARRVELHHVVEVAHVDPELKRARRHDDAVAPLGEGPLGLRPLLARERRVRDEQVSTPEAPQRARH